MYCVVCVHAVCYGTYVLFGFVCYVLCFVVDVLYVLCNCASLCYVVDVLCVMLCRLLCVMCYCLFSLCFSGYMYYVSCYCFTYVLFYLVVGMRTLFALY